MTTVPTVPDSPARPAPGKDARRMTGGLLLALASALGLLALLVSFLLPAVDPAAPAAERAARVLGAAAGVRWAGVLGVFRALLLALASALLAIEPPEAAVAKVWRVAAAFAWRLVLISAVLFLAADLFNAFARIPLAREAAAGRPGPYGFAESLELRIVGAAVVLFALGVLIVFLGEIAGHLRRVGSGWIAFGIVTAAAGIAGGIGVALNLPKLAPLAVVSSLAFVPLLRLGVRVAAGPARPQAPTASRS